MQGDIVGKPSSAGRHLTIAIVGLIVVLSIVAAAAMSSAKKERSDSAAVPTPQVFTPAAATPRLVHYEVDGSASSASVTVETPTGTSQATADLPLKNKSGSKGLIFSGFSSGAFLYISAQNQDEYGTVTCRIKIGDTVISENTSSGAYQIATCQGSF